MKVPDRVVLDTNIWVSYFISGRFVQLSALVFDYKLTLLSSPALADELAEVLSRRKFIKYLTLPVDDYVAFHHSLTTRLYPKIRFTDSPDPKDNFLFDLAIQYRAGYLVTGDRKLLAMPPLKQVQVISLTAFRELLV